MMTAEELEALLTQPEGIDLEFKNARIPASSLGKAIAAFANTNGGTIVVGVDERKGAEEPDLIGIHPRTFERLVRHAHGRLTPPPDVQYYCVPIRGKQIGVIQVAAEDGSYISADGQLVRRIGSETRAVNTKSTPPSLRHTWWNRRRRIFATCLAAVVLPSSVFLVRLFQGVDPSSLAPGTVIVGLSILFSGVVAEFAATHSDEDVSPTRQRVRQAEAELEEGLRSRHAGAPEAEEEEQARLTLSDLWTVTHRRLDHYHGIALGQAERSFRNAQAATAAGFILLILFAVAGLTFGTTAGAIVTGTLGAVSAALGGFISKTFVRSQEAAAEHLRAYFDQPLEFSRYLAAERLITDARLNSEQRAQILSTLVQAMISGPAVPQDDRDVQQPPRGL
ncbi:ATP-binding protein [Streptomyces rubiginosohelvolus]|uniref:AlbA family DNA-binding domain-containing protein n=1 Tax=Streptomyces rubiginosohelvolus TaxID=67362 RepID=UPI0033B6D98C